MKQGDVYIISRQLKEKDNRVEIILIFEPEKYNFKLKEEPKLQFFKRFRKEDKLIKFTTGPIEITNIDLVSDIVKEIIKIKNFLIEREKEKFLKDVEDDNSEETEKENELIKIKMSLRRELAKRKIKNYF